MAHVWLITGASSGFGRQIAIAAAKMADTVVATSRDHSKLEDLKSIGNIFPQRLDICASDADVQDHVAENFTAVGRINVVVNNAGYILERAIQECSDADIEAQFGAHVFGQLRLLRAVLPTMHAQRSGTVANMGSIAGWRGTAGAGLYCATKGAITMYTEALGEELALFGIKTTCIQAGSFRINFLKSDGSHKITATNHIPKLEAANADQVATGRQRPPSTGRSGQGGTAHCRGSNARRTMSGTGSTSPTGSGTRCSAANWSSS